VCFIPILATFCTVIPPVPIILVHTSSSKLYLLPHMPLLRSSICNPPTDFLYNGNKHLCCNIITFPFATSYSMSSTVWHIITYHCIDNFDRSQKRTVSKQTAYFYASCFLEWVDWLWSFFLLCLLYQFDYQLLHVQAHYLCLHCHCAQILVSNLIFISS